MRQLLERFCYDLSDMMLPNSGGLGMLCSGIRPGSCPRPPVQPGSLSPLPISLSCSVEDLPGRAVGPTCLPDIIWPLSYILPHLFPVTFIN